RYLHLAIASLRHEVRKLLSSDPEGVIGCKAHCKAKLSLGDFLSASRERRNAKGCAKQQSASAAGNCVHFILLQRSISGHDPKIPKIGSRSIYSLWYSLFERLSY